MPARIITYICLLLVLGVYHTFAQCTWSECSVSPRCPQGVSITTGHGECPPRAGGECPLGTQRELCCPPAIFFNCQWYGTAPNCGYPRCPYRTQQIGQDIQGDGDTPCHTGCKIYCCDISPSAGNGTEELATAAAMCSAVATGKSGHLFASQPFDKLL